MMFLSIVNLFLWPPKINLLWIKTSYTETENVRFILKNNVDINRIYRSLNDYSNKGILDYFGSGNIWIQKFGLNKILSFIKPTKNC